MKDNTDPSYILQFTFQPIGAAALRHSRGMSNMLNMPPESQAWLGIVAQWTDPKHDETGPKQIRELISRIEGAATKKDKLVDFHFMNDCSYWQDPLRSMGDEKLQFMKDVSLKYDKNGIFQKLQGCGFLLRGQK